MWRIPRFNLEVAQFRREIRIRNKTCREIALNGALPSSLYFMSSTPASEPSGRRENRKIVGDMASP